MIPARCAAKRSGAMSNASRVVAFGPLAAMLLGWAGYVQGHGGDASLMHGCIDNKKATLRIVAPNGACSSKETAQDWKITGPTGPTGPSGSRSEERRVGK